MKKKEVEEIILKIKQLIKKDLTIKEISEELNWSYQKTSNFMWHHFLDANYKYTRDKNKIKNCFHCGNFINNDCEYKKYCNMHRLFYPKNH